MQTANFLVDAQCVYHFHKIMKNIHVAKPDVNLQLCCDKIKGLKLDDFFQGQTNFPGIIGPAEP